MMLDNLFNILGGTTTSAILFGIVAFVGVPALSAVLCPAGFYRPLSRSR